MIDPIEIIKPVYRTIRNKKLLLQSLFNRKFTNIEYYKFQCNICGKFSHARTNEISKRETPSCYHCGSTLRFRSIIAALSKEIFGKVMPISDFPYCMSVNGIGMSDSTIYAKRLEKKFSYVNTFFHKAPFLDIQNPDIMYMNSADFVISSDVFEHVPQPINIAFENLFNMLKDKGLVVFSVPYNETGDTLEHYPDLYDFKIKQKHGEKILVNTTKNGEIQVFKKLRFHGGCGETLELRVFSKPSLLELINNAGFKNIVIHDTDIQKYGILHDSTESLVITMQKN
jgi:SAM-dependent methyltransferase